MESKSVHSILPLLAVAIPFVFALLIAFTGDERPTLRNGVVLVGSILTFVVAMKMFQSVIVEKTLLEYDLHLILGLHFKAHPLGMAITVLASFMWIPTMVYSFGYMAYEHAQTRYYTALTVALGATMAILNAGNLFTFFVFYEIFTLSVYPLVIHEETPEAMAGGRIYLIYLVTGEALVLLTILFIYGITGLSVGSAELIAGGLLAGFSINRSLLCSIAILLTIGFGVKAAIMPLHSWLPEAMVAPTPISAVLHAVAVVKVGVFAVIMLIYIILGTAISKKIGVDSVLPWVASVTIILASLIAITQDDIKRRLAYSTVSQLSYMILGASLLNWVALKGAILHIFFHSFMKIVLFFCAGIIITQSGKKRFSQIAGQAHTMPFTWACFTVGAIGMVGLPPVCGWVSKWTLIQGCLDANKPVFAVVFLVSGFLNLVYFLPPVFSAWFGDEEKPKKKKDGERKLEAPLSMLVPTGALAVGAIFFGINSGFPIWFAERVVNAIF